jgi:hypothetical protein
MCAHEYILYTLCGCKIMQPRLCNECDDPFNVIWCPDYKTLESEDKDTCPEHCKTSDIQDSRRQKQANLEESRSVVRMVEQSSQAPEGIQNPHHPGTFASISMHHTTSSSHPPPNLPRSPLSSSDSNHVHRFRTWRASASTDQDSHQRCIASSGREPSDGRHRSEAVIVAYNPETKEFDRPARRRRMGGVVMRVEEGQ